MKEQTRRKFLAASGSFGAGIVATAALSPISAWADPMGLPIGIQLYTVRDVIQSDTVSTLKALYDMGYREVETAGTGKYSAKDFGQLIRDAGLSCPSAHLPMKSIDPGQVFADAHALGASYAVSSLLRLEVPAESGGAPLQAKTPVSLDDFRKLAAVMNEIGAKTKTAGLQYGYHNHRHEFQKMPDGRFGYDVLIDETDPELVKFEIDCGWMVIGGANPTDYMKKHPSRFRMLHIKDFKSVPPVGKEPQGCELGAGFIRYKEIFAVGKSIGIQHAFAEQEGPYTKPEMESARIDYSYLHSIS